MSYFTKALQKQHSTPPREVISLQERKPSAGVVRKLEVLTPSLPGESRKFLGLLHFTAFDDRGSSAVTVCIAVALI